jgi:hypothetical protein
MRIITFSPRTRAGSLLLGLAILGAGVALLVVGFALLAAVAIGGTLLAAGAAVYYKLRGHGGESLRSSDGVRAELDPGAEVFSDDSLKLPPVERRR